MKDSLNGGYKYYGYRWIIRRDLFDLAAHMVDDRKSAWRDYLRRNDVDSIKKEIAAKALEKDTLLKELGFYEPQDEDFEDVYRRWATDPDLMREVLSHGRCGERFEKMLRDAGYDMLKIAIPVDKMVKDYLVLDVWLGTRWDELLDFLKPKIYKEWDE